MFGNDVGSCLLYIMCDSDKAIVVLTVVQNHPSVLAEPSIRSPLECMG